MAFVCNLIAARYKHTFLNWVMLKRKQKYYHIRTYSKQNFPMNGQNYWKKFTFINFVVGVGSVETFFLRPVVLLQREKKFLIKIKQKKIQTIFSMLLLTLFCFKTVVVGISTNLQVSTTFRYIFLCFVFVYLLLNACFFPIRFMPPNAFMF